PLVGHADHGAARDQLAAVERVLDLLGVDVLTAADDHVVDPADHVEFAVVVEPAQVAGAIPASGDRLGVGIRPLPIAGERLRAVHAGDDLAGLAGWQIDLDVTPRRHHPDDLVHPGAAGTAGLVIEMIAIAEGVDLARAVVVDEQLRLELLQA